MAFTGSYYGNRLIKISIEEYRRSRYVSKCQVMSNNPLRASIFVREDEYAYAREKEARECQPMYYASYMDAPTSCGTSTAYNVSPPVKKKEEKVSKSIRHQFLRKRIAERVNATV